MTVALGDRNNTRDEGDEELKRENVEDRFRPRCTVRPSKRQDAAWD